MRSLFKFHIEKEYPLVTRLGLTIDHDANSYAVFEDEGLVNETYIGIRLLVYLFKVRLNIFCGFVKRELKSL